MAVLLPSIATHALNPGQFDDGSGSPNQSCLAPPHEPTDGRARDDNVRAQDHAYARSRSPPRRYDLQGTPSSSLLSEESSQGGHHKNHHSGARAHQPSPNGSSLGPRFFGWHSYGRRRPADDYGGRHLGSGPMNVGRSSDELPDSGTLASEHVRRELRLYEAPDR
jgi:hypothetical protein